MEQEYCKCENSSSVYSESNELGFWDVCTDCGKVIEDSFENHPGLTEE